MFYPVKTPKLVSRLMPQYLWRINSPEPVIYLTFDDGPIPGVTPWVLDTLAQFKAKATFFCVGDNVRKHPDIYARLLAEGHRAGNHTFNHLNGLKTPSDQYLENVRTCAEYVHTSLFRPPYGRLRRGLRRALATDYQLVLWDVLSGDFDRQRSPEKCLAGVLKHTTPGSIVVFHDSLKAEANLRYTLPRALEVFSQKGWRFEALPL